jgi:RNA polymerase sigma-70 factor, ECF subfamily
MLIARDCPPAKVAARAGFRAASCAERIGSPTGRTLGTPQPDSPKVHPLSAPASDEALIKAVAWGDRHAMALLYGRHHVRVYRFAYRITGDTTLAEDIVSDVFLDIWRQANSFKAMARFSTWLLAVTRNKSLSALRHCADTRGDYEAIEPADPADDPETATHKSARSDIIRRCLLHLSPTQREVLDLVYYHEKSIAEVAEIVGIPANTVKTRMFHARKRMGEFLRAAGHDAV